MRRKGRTFQWPWREQGQIQSEVDEEIEFHLEMRTQELIAQGIDPLRARDQAEEEFGNLSAARHDLASLDVRVERERRRVEWLGEFLQDFRFGLRTLRTHPGFTLVTLLTLALGVGVNNSIFSVVNGVLFKPLPFFEEEQLVSVWPRKGLQKAEYEILEENSSYYESLSLYQSAVGFSLAADGRAERLVGAYVSGDLFQTLGVTPLLGRALQKADQEPGATPVVVLGESLWKRAFGGRSDILSSHIELEGISRTIVGVMPADFSFPQRETEIWVPLTIDPGNAGDYWGTWGGFVVGRLRTGRTPLQAQAELRVLSRRMRLENPLWTPLEEYGQEARVEALRSQLVGEVRPLLMLLLGAVFFVLLVACANVGNLLLAKGLSRQREWALRGALGASRARLIRQVLTESLVLGLGAGILGFGLATAGQAGLHGLLPPDLPRVQEVDIDYAVFFFSLAIALLTGILAGLVPALRVGRSDLRAQLVEGGRGTRGPARRGLSRSLVAGEIALAVMLVSCAVLLAQSFLHLWETDTGFRREEVVRAVISPPLSKYQDPQKQRAFYQELLARLEPVSGLEGLAVASQVPFDNRVQRAAIFIEGVTENPNVLPMFDLQGVTPGYFRVMGIPLVKGRAFDSSDRAGAPRVAIIDQRAAERFWPGKDPIGERLGRPWLNESVPIVGVVGSVRNQSLSGEERPALYFPFLQYPSIEARLVVHSRLGPDTLAPIIRAAVEEIDPETPVSRIHSNREAIEATLGKPGLAALLLLSFSLLALLLGGIGIYGIVAYSVRQRRAEIGVRMALGANSADVTRLLLREGFWMSGAGIVLGLLGVLACSPLLQGLLFGVEGHDPMSLVESVLVLAAVSLLACYLPARRALHINPLEALRQD